MSTLLFPQTPLTLSQKPFLLSLRNPSFLPHTRKWIRPRGLILAKSNGNDSVDTTDRIISAVCYFYPFFDGSPVRKIRHNPVFSNSSSHPASAPSYKSL
ncbi:hypothetical protein OIU84_015116 [Salix udensis]|uniref:Uncharacterized protein n=1 Tax=Salix udensis TaxID=889485 RepID=A0AAD6JDY9_9ROSI|nr:hypothetical protein OIU84_015116 [Salix udensis]